MSGAGMRDVVPPKAFSLEVGLELLEPPRDCPLDTAADELGVTSRTDRPVVSRKLPPCLPQCLRYRVPRQQWTTHTHFRQV